MQNHPANQVSVTKVQVLTKNIFLPAASVAGSGRSDPSGLCQCPAEEIGCGELMILAGGAEHPRSVAGSAGGLYLEYDFSPGGSGCSAPAEQR